MQNIKTFLNHTESNKLSFSLLTVLAVKRKSSLLSNLTIHIRHLSMNVIWIQSFTKLVNAVST